MMKLASSANTVGARERGAFARERVDVRPGALVPVGPRGSPIARSVSIVIRTTFQPVPTPRGASVTEGAGFLAQRAAAAGPRRHPARATEPPPVVAGVFERHVGSFVPGPPGKPLGPFDRQPPDPAAVEAQPRSSPSREAIEICVVQPARSSVSSGETSARNLGVAPTPRARPARTPSCGPTSVKQHHFAAQKPSRQLRSHASVSLGCRGRRGWRSFRPGVRAGLQGLIARPRPRPLPRRAPARARGAPVASHYMREHGWWWREPGGCLREQRADDSESTSPSPRWPNPGPVDCVQVRRRSWCRPLSTAIAREICEPSAARRCADSRSRAEQAPISPGCGVSIMVRSAGPGSARVPRGGNALRASATKATLVAPGRQ